MTHPISGPTAALNRTQPAPMSATPPVSARSEAAPAPTATDFPKPAPITATATPAVADTDKPNPVKPLALEDLRAAFMATAKTDNWDARADLNADGVVNFQDLAAFKARSQEAPPAQPDLADIKEAFLATPDSKNWNAGADLNGDGQINFADLAELRAQLTPAPPPPPMTLADLREAFMATADSTNWNPQADLDGDGTVNFADLAVLRANMADTA